MSGKKRVLITGCGEGGIGEALASEYYTQGCAVIATVLPHESDEHLHRLGCLVHVLDVTDQRSIDVLTQYVEKVFEHGLDILVNNAGICYTMTAIDTDVKQVERMFNVNVFGPMRMLARFHPNLVKAKGLVINIGSVGGIVPFTYGSSYNATKAALVHWGSTARIELAPLGVRVMNVVSGNIGTNILKADASRELPKGSYYAPLNEQFKLHVSRPAGATDRFKYAKAVVTESLKSSPRAWFWFGDSTWLVWILDTFGWRTIWDTLLWRMFDLGKLQTYYRN